MFERFTHAARDVVVRARREAYDLGHPILGTEHLLLGLLADTRGLGGPVLSRLGLEAATVRESIEEMLGRCRGADLDAEALGSIGIDLDAVRRRVEQSFGPGALDRLRDRGGSRLRVSPRANKALELALRESVRRRDGAIGTEHVLLGILREGKGLAAVVLARAGIDRAAVEAALTDLGRRGQADTG